jgi:hypothetical protein
MKVRRAQFSLRHALLATAGVALLLFWLHSRPARVKFAVCSINDRTWNLEPYASAWKYREATISIANRTPYTVWYWGEPHGGQPDYVLLQEYHQSWNQCGSSTNISTWVKLPARQSLTLSVPLEDEATAFKLGLTFKGARFGASTKQWSGKHSVRSRNEPIQANALIQGFR